MEHRKSIAETANLLDSSTIFGLLRDPRRRIVLSLLLVHDRKLTMNDLTKEVADREYDAPITDIPGEELTRIIASLHHNHIPKMVDAGIVEYDDSRRIVEPTERLDQVHPYLTVETSDISRD